MIMGKIDPAKVLKKLQKTGKTVEMILAYKFENISNDDEEHKLEAFQQPDVDPLISDTLGETPMYTIFSDENPNACSVM
ncbi:hypothetical protein Ccrd_008102 [Cynara cardunculus var. scolymus]|uniref:Uncharacterized protein n=1 Tax=Cynara cardunculus var. scolymus TaxID=59895 RepID=A0A124SB91_CYNCS|nr:hypothetical protein Ccrd_008102 [Cynara cardunculus var. scolymus]